MDEFQGVVKGVFGYSVKFGMKKMQKRRGFDEKNAKRFSINSEFDERFAKGWWGWGGVVILGV